MGNNKIPPSERIRKVIKRIIEFGVSKDKEGDFLKELMKKAKLLIIEELLEREVEEFLER